jgi:hypothetical protein
MDEIEVLQKFRRQKIITLEQLVQLLQCSAITVRRRLKKWRTYTSINKNGRYYTLPQIPAFDENGLWKYQTVLFSKHGNLKQTVIELIRQSPSGLDAGQIAKKLDLAANNSFFSQLKNVAVLKREKHQGRFVYFSDSAEIYDRQKQQRMLSDHQRIELPTDAEAVVILVQLIKHPDISIERLVDKIVQVNKRIEADAIKRFLQFHGLLKKTLDTKP